MDSNVYIQLIFLCIVNLIFTFSGIILNTLVIASFWKSSQLRRKLCHFMIMVLSCFDLVAVVAIYPALMLCLISWLAEDYDLLPKMMIYLYVANLFLASSFLTLLVISIERYLGAYYPIFHRTSVTKRRLLAVHALCLIVPTTLLIISVNDFIISGPVASIILIALFSLPFTFVNFKLFTTARKVLRQRILSPENNKAIHVKNIFTGLLAAVVCGALLSIPGTFYIAFGLSEKSNNTSRELAFIWSVTCAAMNCTLNSLIFFWRNKVLRAEGMKILNTLKDRLVGC